MMIRKCKSVAFQIGDVVRFEGSDSDGEFSGSGTVERVDRRHLLVAAAHRHHGASMYPGAVVLVTKRDAELVDRAALASAAR